MNRNWNDFCRTSRPNTERFVEPPSFRRAAVLRDDIPVLPPQGELSSSMSSSLVSMPMGLRLVSPLSQELFQAAVPLPVSLIPSMSMLALAS